MEVTEVMEVMEVLGFPDTAAPYEYVALLGACLLLTLPLELLLGARVYRQPLRLALTLTCLGSVFVTWDLVGAGLGHWDYVEARTTGVRILGLPLEEYLFFLVVPLCAVLTYEAVRLTLDDVSRWLGARLERLRRRRGRALR